MVERQAVCSLGDALEREPPAPIGRRALREALDHDARPGHRRAREERVVDHAAKRLRPRRRRLEQQRYRNAEQNPSEACASHF